MPSARVTALPASAAAAVALAALAALSAVGASACRPRPAMCGAVADCGARGACVAGRCQSDAGTPQVELATRYVSEPVDVACIDDDDTTSGAMPASCNLGRSGATRLLLRFSVPLSEQAEIVEAYVLLHRAPDRDPEPVRFAVHASRVVGEWSGATLTSATLPPFATAHSAETRVDRADLVRIDVRDIVKQWRRKDPADRGLVLESSGGRGAGLELALTPTGNGGARGPLLELYVK